MKWIDKPTEPGFYWVKCVAEYENEVYLVEIEMVFGILHLIKEVCDLRDAKYYGPLKPPEEEGLTG